MKSLPIKRKCGAKYPLILAVLGGEGQERVVLSSPVGLKQLEKISVISDVTHFDPSCPRTPHHRCLKVLASKSVHYHTEKGNLFLKLNKLTCSKSMKSFLHDSILTVNKNLSVGWGIEKKPLLRL